MLVMSNQRAEVEMIVDELANLQHQWNLRLNKRKSEILTGEKDRRVAESTELNALQQLSTWG
jgi:hypothetical protein